MTLLPNNLTNYPYPSSRPVILGKKCAVATSQPLATLAGMEMFNLGGNAVDAAIAMAITLTVVEPTSNGIGSDAFALVWDGNLHGLNASGKSPQNLTKRYFNKDKINPYGWQTVTVPGAVSAWRNIWERWGKLPFEQLFTPAIRYAESGFPVSPVTADAWRCAEGIYLSKSGKEFQTLKDVFFPGGRSPGVGEIWRSELHAKTLAEIAATGGESFYRGRLAQQISDFAAISGGFLTPEDLASHQAEWVQPIATDYRGYNVWEIPPNTQGLATLMGLNILEGFDLAKYPRESIDSYHLQIEAMKLAFADVHRYTSDPNYMEFSVDYLLDKSYAAMRRQLIGNMAIPLAQPGLPKGGTVYLAAADNDLMVSFIQSNYMGFGSGVMIPGTGIALQNRGAGFSLEKGHPNEFGPGKRPFHTIMPGFITKNGEALGPFGVMGGPMQPQGHLQVIVNMVDYGMNPQAALDAPRWQFIADNRILLEPMVSQSVMMGLIEKGHDVAKIGDRDDLVKENLAASRPYGAQPGLFGRGQVILRHHDILVAASEPRSDGMALAW